MRYLLIVLFCLAPSVCWAYPTHREMQANAQRYRQSQRSSLNINGQYHRNRNWYHEPSVVVIVQKPTTPWPYNHYPNKRIPRTTRTPRVTYNPSYTAPAPVQPLTIINPYFKPSEKK